MVPSERKIDFEAGKVVLSGKTHNFERIKPLYGSKFTLKLLKAWEHQFKNDNQNTTEKKCGALRRLLMWIAAEAHKDQMIREVFEALQACDHNAIDFILFRGVLDKYVSKLRDPEDEDIVRSKNLLTRKPIIEATSTVLQRLAKEGLWPDIGSIKSISSKLLKLGNTPSLGELMPGRVFKAREPSSELPEEIVRRSKERLYALRKIMERELLQSYALFLEGQKLLKRKPVVSPDQLDQWLHAPKGPVPGLLRKWIHRDRSKPADQGLTCLLHWLFSKKRNRVATTQVPIRARWLLDAYGGVDLVTSYLEARHDALLPAYTIALIDTGFNVQTCDDLPRNPFVKSVVNGRTRIETVSAKKNRSGGDTVSAAIGKGWFELSNKTKRGISGVEVIKIWQKMSQPIWQRAKAQGDNVHRYLWIIPSGRSNKNAVIRYDAFAFKHWWGQFMRRHERHPIIGGLPIQRKMIRPTVLQLRAVQKSFTYEVAQTLAGHKHTGTTMSYLSRAWFRNFLSREIRKFQNLYEAALVKDIRDVSDKLGISINELDSRISLAEETGLGFVCAQRFVKKPNHQDCNSIEACATCNFRRFVPTDSALRALVLTNISLLAQWEEFSVANGERWKKVWLPYLALSQAILNKLLSGPYRWKTLRAKDEIKRAIKSGKLVMVPLW